MNENSKIYGLVPESLERKENWIVLFHGHVISEMKDVDLILTCKYSTDIDMHLKYIKRRSHSSNRGKSFSVEGHVILLYDFLLANNCLVFGVTESSK